jgi:two-component system, cell cycle sensor histidine kinase PleC
MRKRDFYLFAALIGLFVVVWGAIGIMTSRDRQQALEEMAERSGQITQFYERHVSTTIRYADDYIKTLRRIYSEGGSLAAMRLHLAEIPPNPAVLSHITLMDVDGVARLISTGKSERKAKPGVQANDRDYFKFHMNNTSDAVYVSAARQGRNTGLLTVRVVRRVETPDGKFAGVIFAAIKAEQLLDFFEPTRLGPRSSATLVGLDKRIRLRRSQKGFDGIGRNIERSMLWESLQKTNAGTYHQTSIVDQIPRLWTYRRIPDYPLVAVVGSAFDDALENQSNVTRFRYTVGVLISIIGIVLVFLARRAVAVTRLETEIAESRRLEAELLDAKFRAEEASRSKSNFLANMSHELRTPLNSIIGYSEALKEEHLGHLDSPKLKEYMIAIHDSGRYLLGLINTILDISKIEANRDELDEAVLDVTAVMRDSLRHLRHLAEARNISFHANPPGPLPRMKGDAGKLTQLFINLLNNAVKFTRGGGDVWFAVTLDDNQGFVFTVEDNGIGIAAENLSRIVEPFEQVGDAMTTPQEGTGLGLAISDSLVKLHGGAMKIESELGVGTSITISFPPERTLQVVDQAQGPTI